jgi:hypothetical protein
MIFIWFIDYGKTNYNIWLFRFSNANNSKVKIKLHYKMKRDFLTDSLI